MASAGRADGKGRTIMSRRFLIPTLLAAGFGYHDPLQATLTGASSTATDDPDNPRLFQLFRQDHLFTLAQHRSHSSHRSSTGGYSGPVYRPPPVYTPPSNPAPSSTTTNESGSSGSSGSGGTARPLYSAPNSTTATPQGLPSLSGRSAAFKTIVMHVQVALMGRGLFEGTIDGNVGPATRAALRQFQQSSGLSVTGTITTETLDALHVSSQVGE